MMANSAPTKKALPARRTTSHSAPGHVARRPHVVAGRAQVIVDGDVPAVVHLHPGGAQAEVPGDRRTSRGIEPLRGTRLGSVGQGHHHLAGRIAADPLGQGVPEYVDTLISQEICDLGGCMHGQRISLLASSS